jgi:hypothetical protein
LDRQALPELDMTELEERAPRNKRSDLIMTRKIDRRASDLVPLSARAFAIGAQAIGALAAGALAIGAVALGAVAIGRLAIGHSKIKRIEIDELVVKRLRITDSLETPAGHESESN